MPKPSDKVTLLRRRRGQRGGSRIGARGVCAGLILSLILLGACDTFGRERRTAISSSATGSGIEVHFVACSVEVVRTVTLLEPRGQIIGDEDDPVLWRISSPGSTLRTFVVGEVPQGFREVVALGDLPPPDRKLGIVIDTSLRSGDFATFRVEQLRGDSVLWEGKQVSLADFLEGAMKECG